VLRDGGAYVSCKMSFSNSSGVHPLVGCTVSAGSSSPPLFVSYWDMMKCIFLHRFLLLYSLSFEQASREQVSLILVAVEVGPPVVSRVLQLMTSMSYCALPFK